LCVLHPHPSILLYLITVTAQPNRFPLFW
jgi:hypothetical protein